MKRFQVCRPGWRLAACTTALLCAGACAAPISTASGYEASNPYGGGPVSARPGPELYPISRNPYTPTSVVTDVHGRELTPASHGIGGDAHAVASNVPLPGATHTEGATGSFEAGRSNSPNQANTASGQPTPLAAPIVGQVPEPSTLLLTAAGLLVGLIWAIRRRHH